MVGQLGHLLSVMPLPGGIPFAARDQDMWALETFGVFDDQRVDVGLLTAQVTLTAPGEVAMSPFQPDGVA